MGTHIVLIRGINVGTGKRVAMAELREELTGLGYRRVRTLLNSGNAVVDTDDEPAAVAAAVSDVLAGALGVSAAVIVRSPDQVVAAMADDPFGALASEGSKHFLGFLADTPAPGAVEKIAELREFQIPRGDATAPDLARVIRDHLYLWCPNGISKSTFTKLNWDRALGTPVTVRNWNTVTKLVELAG